MRVITLHEPWATLMALGHKTIETRGWPTDCRGDLAIHAAKTMPAYARDACRENRAIRQILTSWTAGTPAEGIIFRAPQKYFPLGKILCVVEMVMCRKMVVASDGGYTNWWDSIKSEASPSCDFAIEWDLGNWEDGRFAWITRNCRPLKNPIAATGKQGFWEYPTDQIRAAL
jgi:hypothetical protein